MIWSDIAQVRRNLNCDQTLKTITTGGLHSNYRNACFSQLKTVNWWDISPFYKERSFTYLPTVVGVDKAQFFFLKNAESHIYGSVSRYSNNNAN